MRLDRAQVYSWEQVDEFVRRYLGGAERDRLDPILDAIDLDSYRVEKQAMQKIRLPDGEAEIGPVPTSAGGHRPEPELDRLSNILRTFNEHFGDFRWEDADRVASFERWLTDTVFSLAYEPASTR